MKPERVLIWGCFSLFGLTILSSLLWVTVVSLGYFPALGGDELGFTAFAEFFRQSRFFAALRMTIITALLATSISVVLSFAFLAAFAQHRIVQRLSSLLAPILAVPHGLLAMAVIILFAPTGWIVRWFWSFTVNSDLPPQYLFAPDSWGVGLVLALVMKETAFLLLMLLGHLGQARYRSELHVARSLGYGQVAAWLKVLLPQLYPKIRLPILAVLAFSASNVEVALVTNSFNAPTVSILILRFFQHVDLLKIFPAAAGSIVLLLVCLGLVAVWLGIEKIVCLSLRATLSNGSRQFFERSFPWVVGLTFALMLVVVALGLLAMIIQAASFRWPFPEVLPSSWIFQRPELYAANLARDVVFNSIVLVLAVRC